MTRGPQNTEVVGSSSNWETLRTPVTQEQLLTIREVVNRPRRTSPILERARQLIEIIITQKNEPIEKGDLMTALQLDRSFDDPPKELGRVIFFLHKILEEAGIHCRIETVVDERYQHVARGVNLQQPSGNRKVKFHNVRLKTKDK